MWTTTPPDKPGYYWFRLLDIPAQIFKVESFLDELEVRTYDGQTVSLKDWPFTGGEWLQDVPVTDWMPIATAPKDGTCILALSLHYNEPFVCYWGNAAYERGDTPGLPEGTVIGKHWCITNCEDGDGILYDPTHWMPLPSAALTKAGMEG